MQAGCAFFAYQRFKQGVDAAFAPSYESDPTANAYSSYPVGNEPEQYNDPPFGQQQQQQRGKHFFIIVDLSAQKFIRLERTKVYGRVL